MNVAAECARILNCPIKSLRDQLNHPSKRALIVKELIGRQVSTTYPNRSGNNHKFTINGLTTNGADSTMAYGRLGRPFNICVAAHYYARHRIRLEYPYLPCAIQNFAAPGEDRYYALELLEFVEDEDDEEEHHHLCPDCRNDDDEESDTWESVDTSLYFPHLAPPNCPCHAHRFQEDDANNVPLNDPMRGW